MTAYQLVSRPRGAIVGKKAYNLPLFWIKTTPRPDLAASEGIPYNINTGNKHILYDLEKIPPLSFSLSTGYISLFSTSCYIYILLTLATVHSGNLTKYVAHDFRRKSYYTLFLYLSLSIGIFVVFFL